MKFVGLGNYLKMFKDRYFVNALKNIFGTCLLMFFYKCLADFW